MKPKVMDFRKMFYTFLVLFTINGFTNGISILEEILRLNLNETQTIGKECRNDLALTQINLDMDEVWAVKLIDASGRVLPGFIWGNNYWISAKEMCQVMKEQSETQYSDRYKRRNHPMMLTARPPFDLNYQVVYLRHSSIYQIDQKIYDKSTLHIGVCMPKSCSSNETASLIETVLLQNNNNEYGMIGNNFTIIHSKVIETPEDTFTNPFIIILLVSLSIIFFLIFVSTIYTFYIRKSVMKEDRVIEVMTEANYHTKQPKPFWDTFLCAFSFIENIKRFKSREFNKKTVKTIHGIRGVGMLWIVIAHIYFFSFGSIDNMQLAMNFQDLLIAQPFLNAAIQVDTFFALSGFLLAYSFFESVKQQKKRRPIRMLIKAIALRYLRLTIPYLPVLLATTSLNYYLEGASTFMFLDQTHHNCRNYWWRNLLYINNWWPMSEMCMISTWYLSVDFQCFLITMILLLISIKYPKTAVALMSAVFVAACGYSGYIGYREGFSFKLDVQFNTIDTLYYPTYTRLGGYLVGVLGGYYFVNLNREMKLSKPFIYCGWIIASILGISIFFGQTFRSENVYLGALFTAICRPLWAGVIIWIIYMCSLHHGGYLQKMLHAKSLIPYSRLAYAAYLINPVIIFWVSMISDVPFHIELVSTSVYAFGYILFIYFCAKIFSLFFEYPFVRLIKAIMKLFEKEKVTNKNEVIESTKV